MADTTVEGNESKSSLTTRDVYEKESNIRCDAPNSESWDRMVYLIQKLMTGSHIPVNNFDVFVLH